MKTIKVLVVTGGGYHDFERCGALLEGFLAAAGDMKVTRTTERSAIQKDNLSKYDVLLIYTQGDGLSNKQVRELDDWVHGGGALVGLHCASDSFRNHRDYVALLGSEFIGHGPVHPFEVSSAGHDHYITRRIEPFTIEDELYLLEGDGSRWTTLMDSPWQSSKQPMVYVREPGKGKVCYIALGHGEAAFNNPILQKITLRALRWATGAKEKAPVRCGVIGYGGQFNMGKMHGDGISRIRGLEFTAVCDLDPERAKAGKADFPQAEAFTNVTKMLAKKDLDLVVLITPHNTHAPLAIQAARAGKHVITEKPMCLTTKEATGMIDAAKKSGTLLSVFHNRRWDGDYLALRKLVAEGVIGEVFQIETFIGGYGHPGWWWRSDKKISGGCLYDWGAHFVDWILNLIPSPVESVTGSFQKRMWPGVTNEDHTVAMIRFKNGALATVEISSLAAAPKDRWRVLGTKGAASMRDYDDHAWTVTRYAGGSQITGKVPYQKSDWVDYYRNIADHLTMGEELLVKPEQGRRTIAVIETAEKSAKTGKSMAVPYEE
jgi:predicted dehydrogenase